MARARRSPDADDEEFDEDPSDEDIERLEARGDEAFCPECGAVVWDDAAVCPACGETIEGRVSSRPPLQQWWRGRWLVVLVVVLVLAVLGVLGLVLRG